MAMYVTNETVLGINDVAIRRTAKCLRIENVDFKGWLELYNDIEATRDDIFNLLDNLIVAYRQWHNFHVLLEHENVQGDLDWIQSDVLTRLIQTRDETRNILIRELERRSC